MILRRSAVRTMASCTTSILAIAVFGAVTMRWQSGHWPAAEFYISSAAVAAAFPLVLWVLHVPRFIELTDDSLTIAQPFTRPITVSVDDLEYYGQTVAYFRMQLRGHRSLRIFSRGFPRDQWRSFMQELESRFPERYASVWVL